MSRGVRRSGGNEQRGGGRGLGQPGGGAARRLTTAFRKRWQISGVRDYFEITDAVVVEGWAQGDEDGEMQGDLNGRRRDKGAKELLGDRWGAGSQLRAKNIEE
ncbi:hypothetical protein DFH06DRAFT_1129080 [Mycena polygramma]|nr:hypothetical protein DFH06DRAFT_1129080 [Mycena polygramma]